MTTRLIAALHDAADAAAGLAGAAWANSFLGSLAQSGYVVARGEALMSQHPRDLVAPDVDAVRRDLRQAVEEAAGQSWLMVRPSEVEVLLDALDDAPAEGWSPEGWSLEQVEVTYAALSQYSSRLAVRGKPSGFVALGLLHRLAAERDRLRRAAVSTVAPF